MARTVRSMSPAHPANAVAITRTIVRLRTDIYPPPAYRFAAMATLRSAVAARRSAIQGHAVVAHAGGRFGTQSNSVAGLSLARRFRRLRAHGIPPR
jgi:hypothetical protein